MYSQSTVVQSHKKLQMRTGSLSRASRERRMACRNEENGGRDFVKDSLMANWPRGGEGQCSGAFRDRNVPDAKKRSA